MRETIDGIVNEPIVNFVGKDGFFWWVGEVEDNEDPMELGRVKCRVLGYYTNVRGGTTSALPTESLPWATVLQHTCQAGNDGQGESAGQLQPGAIVMGFFMDGENAQMPIVIGVLRVQKSNNTKTKQQFAFTGEAMEPGVGVNASALHPTQPNNVMAGTLKEGFQRQGPNNTVAMPGMKTAEAGGPGSPMNIGTVPGVAGSASNTSKPRDPEKPIPAANGVGGPWKTLEYKLSYLVEDIANTAGTLVKGENGDFYDIVTGKLVTAKALTAKLQNFLSAVFTQVVSAVRQSLANLAEQLELVNLLGGATGVPFVVFTTIQQAVVQILSQLCIIDANLIGYISDPIGSVLSIVEGFLEGLIDQAAMVVQSVQKVIDDIICNVQKILDTALSIVDVVKGIVDGVGQAKEVIDAWQKGSEIFEDGVDLFKKGITSLTGLMSLFLKFAGSGCNRPIEGGEDTVGWYPLFGVTHCSPEELESINKIRGKSRGSCGDQFSGISLIDNILNEADPYLSAAKNYVNGAYDLWIGTPGRQATVKRQENGTQHTSVKINNNTYAEWLYKRQMREKNPDISEEELESKVKEYQKKQAPNGDESNLVADHISYAGTRTEEVHGDDCQQVDRNKVINVDGDYHLDITGNCHITVGGSFLMNAQGSPTVVDSKGEKKSEKIQKHAITFGSDLDMAVVGAKYELQASEINLAGLSTKITGSIFENSSSQQTMAGAEIIIAAENYVTISATTLFETINFPPSPIPKVKAGILRKVGGSCETIMTPTSAASDVVPRYTVMNPSGPVTVTSGATGYTNTVTTGSMLFTNALGPITTLATVGPITTTAKAGAISILAPAQPVTVKGLSIFLN